MGETTKTTLTRVSQMIFAITLLMASYSLLSAQSADLTIGSMIIDKSIVTVRGKNLTFNGLSKSQVDAGYSIIGITDNAKKGKVKVIGNSQLEYNPHYDTCDSSDMFSFMIGNGALETEQEYSVEVLCDTLATMSSLSPANNGEDDSFVILGIDNYPKNELVIFNDLGLQIFKKVNYSNDWDGTYQGRILPRGVYYYVFQTGTDQVISGYLHMGDRS